MPKLQDYDNTMFPMSPQVQMNVDARVAAGGWSSADEAAKTKAVADAAAQVAVQGGQVTSQWSPLTLQGAGLYHIAMGAVLGLAAYGRSQEKIAGKS